MSESTRRVGQGLAVDGGAVEVGVVDSGAVAPASAELPIGDQRDARAYEDSDEASEDESDVDEGSEELELEFAGSAREYFSVWIVNLCLTLLSFGVFSAWAKVRSQRYFYSHLRLDGTPLQYLGEPLPILKGRIVAVVLLAAWFAATSFAPVLLPGVLVVGAIVAPWVLVRSASFRARASAFRNMRFDFSGTYWGAFKVLLGGVLFSVLTLGFGYPTFRQRLARFLVKETHYGGRRAGFFTASGVFFVAYFQAGLLVMLAGLPFVLLLGPSFLGDSNLYGYSAVSYGGYLLAFAHIRARITNAIWNGTSLGPIEFQSSLRTWELFGLYFTNLLAIIVSFGLLIPWAMIRTLRYRVSRLTVWNTGSLSEFSGSPSTAVSATGAEVADLFDFELSL